MRLLSAILLISSALLAVNAQARSCGNLPKKIDNNKLYAEVISRSHMDLEFVIVAKSLSRSKVKVTGGYGYNAQKLPTCEMEAVKSLDWLNSNIGTDFTFGQNGHTAAYTICSYNFRGKLVDSYTVCHYEVGD